MAFPSTISTFNQVSASDRLNSPSHSALHNDVSSVLTQVQTVIGTNVASAIGTIIGDLRNPTSDGGGHVQSAVKGGTGQTTFIKGDMFVATGPSTISKLAVGGDGTQLVADSSMAPGVKWGAATGSKLNANASIISAFDVPEVSVMSVSVPGSTLGTTNAIRGTAYINMQRVQNTSILVKGLYGGNVVTSVMINSATTVNTSIYGTVNFTLLANNSATAQRGYMSLEMQGMRNNISAVTSILSMFLYNTNTSSVNSAAAQTFGVTVKPSDGGDRFGVDGSVIEKIV